MKKILIVEDEDIILNLLQHKLAQEGYEATTARDGQEGLEKMKQTKPDLILLDIVLPKLGGFEVMEEMQKEPDLRSTPVIIISNSGQPVELEKAKELGAKDWLIKTEFDPKEVVEKVVNQIGK